MDTPLMCWPQILKFKDDTKVSIVTISPITDSESMALLDHSTVSFIHTIIKETSFRGCLSSKHSYKLCSYTSRVKLLLFVCYMNKFCGRVKLMKITKTEKFLRVEPSNNRDGTFSILRSFMNKMQITELFKY